MKDPGTSFGAWFQQVKAREQRAGAAGGGLGGSGGAAGSGRSAADDGVVSKLMFWRRGSDADGSQQRGSGRRNGEDGTDVERGGLLPSFMRRSGPGRDSQARGSWLDCCDCGLSAAQRFQGFVACIIGGAALMAIALFLFLPVVLLFPAKFALTFTLGSFLIQAAFALLRGPAKHLRGMFARERVVGTVMYLASMGLTLYAAIIARSYILVMLAVSAQVGTLLWSSVSYLPRGQAALSIFTTLFCKAARLMCYPCQAAMRRLVFYCMGYKPGAGI